MNLTSFRWETAPQLGVIQLLLATFIPSGIACIAFHVILPSIVRSGLPVLVAWSAVASMALLAFLVVAVGLLRTEARRLGVTLWSRMCLTNPPLRLWLLAAGVFAVVVILSWPVGLVVVPVMQVVGFNVPDYMPFFLNPEIDPLTTDMTVLSPDLPLRGRYALLPLVGVTLVLNILTEELYFRAWMLPKLSRYGVWGWAINGVLFAFYHLFQLWLLPVLLVVSLGSALICYLTRSIWPAFAAHLILNMLALVGLLTLILGL